ncbi:MAG: HNH endonuclease signature motif containing protein [Dehalococcoidales bacterium]|jgi:hypothetical protein
MENKYKKYPKRINGKLIDEHRYIWMKNYGEIPEGYEIHHINGIKYDNRIKNLQIVTRSEHAKIHGYKPISTEGQKFIFGHKPVNRILTDEKAKMLKEMIKKRGTLSLQKLADYLGFKKSLLQDISVGRSYIYI